MVGIQNDMATLENSVAVFYKGWSLPYEAAILSLSFHPKKCKFMVTQKSVQEIFIAAFLKIKNCKQKCLLASKQINYGIST